MNVCLRKSLYRMPAQEGNAGRTHRGAQDIETLGLEPASFIAFVQHVLQPTFLRALAEAARDAAADGDESQGILQLALLAVAVGWNANILKKLSKVGAQWRQLRGR